MLKTELDRVHLAAQWFLNSGIQSEEGGFFAWHELNNNSFAYLYSEITGYGMTTLLFLDKILKDPHFIDRAKKAASWIIESALHPCGGVKTRCYKDDIAADKRYSFSGENIFSFDTGMVLYGMVMLYKATDDKKFLQVSKKMADFLIDKTQNKNGSLAPTYNAETATASEPQDKWSNQSTGFHAKVSMGLVELFDITKEDFYRRSAIRLCEYALKMQEGCGRFITDKINRTTHLHPHSYAAEGLLYTGASLKIKEFIESAKNSVEWAFGYINADGINELYEPSSGHFNSFQRSDILAQLLRLGLIFSMDEKRIDDLKDALIRHQYIGNDSKQRGGFLYSMGLDHINSWCTMFALQALYLYKNSQASDNMKPELFI
jgi:uncharacterized protein YyaL (SSP411 family)